MGSKAVKRCHAVLSPSRSPLIRQFLLPDGASLKCPLNPRQVKSRKPGAHAYQNGLNLIVYDNGERVWAYRFTDLDGKHAQQVFSGRRLRGFTRQFARGEPLSRRSSRRWMRFWRTILGAFLNTLFKIRCGGTLL
jgi:hypothetical protein